jgi:hypothetical protein
MSLSRNMSESRVSRVSVESPTSESLCAASTSFLLLGSMLWGITRMAYAHASHGSHGSHACACIQPDIATAAVAVSCWRGPKGPSVRHGLFVYSLEQVCNSPAVRDETWRIWLSLCTRRICLSLCTPPPRSLPPLLASHVLVPTPSPLPPPRAHPLDV